MHAKRGAVLREFPVHVRFHMPGLTFCRGHIADGGVIYLGRAALSTVQIEGQVVSLQASKSICVTAERKWILFHICISLLMPCNLDHRIHKLMRFPISDNKYSLLHHIISFITYS